MSTQPLPDQSFAIRWSTVDQLRGLIDNIRQSKSTEIALMGKIKELETQLQSLKKSKRYGLVWEDKPEDVVEQCKKELPVLVSDESKTIEKNPNWPTHILIEGDNFHALTTLAYTHKGKVDVIYIDPPYNTGSADWKYNNNYVDSNDTFRHSKWLSMMANRLRVAKTLLKDSWSIICAIDHNELNSLWILLEELFSSRDITCISIIHNPSGVQWKNFSHNNEYAYFIYPRGNRAINLEQRSQEDADIRGFMNGAKWKTTNYLRSSWPKCFYPILVQNGVIIWFWDVPDESFHPVRANIVKNDGIIEIYPITEDWEERKWLFSRESVEEIKNDLHIEFNQRKQCFQVIRTKTQINYKTVWVDSRFNAKTHGTLLLWKILPIEFPFPKSLHLVKDCIKAVIHDQNNAIILDFFAGSWTTGHAVLELNKEDGGNRQFILCTNNENKIAEEVTYPRIRNVIQGYSDVPGIPANLRYYRTDFIGTEKSIDDLRKKFIYRCTDLLQIREGCFTPYAKDRWTENFQIFESPKKLLAILYNPLEIEHLKSTIFSENRPISVYLFSMGVEIFEEELAEYSDRIKFETIPDEILSTYQKIFGF